MFLTANINAARSEVLIEARKLAYPLGLSLALHALVFWSAPDVSPSPERSATRKNSLRANLHPKPAAEPVEKPLFSPVPSSEPAPKRQPEKPVASPPESPPAPEAEAASPLENEQAEAPSNLPSSPIEPIRPGIDLAGLREYHMALGQKARQFRRYPEEARASGWRGRVTMRLFISEAGSPLGIRLLDSSGFPILDRAGLEMILLSASHTDVPESLRGRAFNIDLAIDYNPDDAP